MNILMLSGDFYPVISGGAREDWVFARQAAADGNDVLVYTDRPPGTDKRERKEGVEIRRPYRIQPVDRHPNSPLGQLRRIVMTAVLFLHLVSLPLRQDFTVIYSTNHARHPIAKALSVLYGLPVVNYIAYSPSINEDDPSKPRSVFVFESLIFRLFLGDLVFSRTPQVARKIERLSDAETELSHGILDQEELRTCDLDGEIPATADPSAVQLVYVGRLAPVKNPVGAIELLADLPERYHLWLIGDGQERAAVEAAVREHDLDQRVQLLGERPHEETLRCISAADALVVTSHTEAYPTVVFEALSLSTRVHATPVGILTEIEHDRLHLSPLDEMSDRIRSTDASEDPTGIDDETLARFSMDRFAEPVLDSLRDVSR